MKFPNTAFPTYTTDRKWVPRPTWHRFSRFVVDEPNWGPFHLDRRGCGLPFGSLSSPGAVFLLLGVTAPDAFGDSPERGLGVKGTNWMEAMSTALSRFADDFAAFGFGAGRWSLAAFDATTRCFDVGVFNVNDGFDEMDLALSPTRLTLDRWGGRAETDVVRSKEACFLLGRNACSR